MKSKKNTDQERYEPAKPTEIVIAALKEENGIGPTIFELTNIIHSNRILLIDSNSKDRTVEVAEKYGAKICFQDGKGKGNAVTKATKCLEKDREYVIITDADYTYPEEHLPKMIQILEEKPTVGMVCRNRFHKRPKEDASQNKFYYGNKLLVLAHNLLNGVKLRDPLTGLRVIRANIFKKNCKSNGFEIEVELNSQVAKQGFEITEIPIGYRERLGEKN